MIYNDIKLTEVKEILQTCQYFYYFSRMLFKAETFTFDDIRLHYKQYGAGKKIILAFHGFGQTGNVFESIASSQIKAATVFSFDLFYHGQSFWHNGDQPLSRKYWRDIIDAFLKEKGIERYSLLGFSLGGKFVLATLEAFPGKVDEIILIAPDGIKTNIWYSLATYPLFFRQYFKSLIVRPASFFQLIHLMKRLNIMDRGILKFAGTQMNTIKSRRRVYYAWVVFRKFQFDMAQIAAIINENDIRLTMYLGEYDKIIIKKNMNALLKHLDHYELHLLKTGHNALIKEVAEHLKRERES